MIHGDANTYRKQGCRCEPCRTANSAERAAYRKRVYLARGPMMVDPTGTSRRLQALAYIGWGIESLAEPLDMHPHHISRLRLGRRMIYRRAMIAVARVYDELSMTPGPDAKAAQHARRSGWLGPLAWDDDTIDDPAAWASPGEDTDDLPDDVVVERLLSGHTHWRDATMADRREAARRAFAGAVDGPYSFCERRLGLNTEAIRSVVEAVAA